MRTTPPFLIRVAPPILQTLLLFISWNNKCYPLGPGHYANPIQFLHASDHTKRICCDLSCPYSDAYNISLNPGTIHAILPL